MELMEAIRTRRSIRNYQNKSVEPEKIEKILEAGRLAPSARNAQEWRFVVVQSPQLRQKIMEAASFQSFVAEAPVIIAACAETDERVMQCGQLAYPIDVAIAIDHMTLKAVEEDLGTCWIGAFNALQVQKILGLPDEIRVVQLLTLGYPAKVPVARPRKTLAEIVKYEQW